tara:strand:- start:440 stop:829 length:390 start_codon:yes stop_codon:yes gene_type:complete
VNIKLSNLRQVIRETILESYEAEERVYDNTVLPGEEADVELLAEPDLTHQEDRDDYISDKERLASKKKKTRLQSQEEQEEGLGDEHAIVGAIGPMGAGNGPGHKPYMKSKKLKPKNAMSISKALDEFSE